MKSGQRVLPLILARVFEQRLLTGDVRSASPVRRRPPRGGKTGTAKLGAMDDDYRSAPELLDAVALLAAEIEAAPSLMIRGKGSLTSGSRHSRFISPIF